MARTIAADARAPALERSARPVRGYASRLLLPLVVQPVLCVCYRQITISRSMPRLAGGIDAVVMRPLHARYASFHCRLARQMRRFTQIAPSSAAA